MPSLKVCSLVMLNGIRIMKTTVYDKYLTYKVLWILQHTRFDHYNCSITTSMYWLQFTMTELAKIIRINSSKYSLCSMLQKIFCLHLHESYSCPAAATTVTTWHTLVLCIRHSIHWIILCTGHALYALLRIMVNILGPWWAH